jgi:hypothetical protein
MESRSQKSRNNNINNDNDQSIEYSVITKIKEDPVAIAQNLMQKKLLQEKMK